MVAAALGTIGRAPGARPNMLITSIARIRRLPPSVRRRHEPELTV